MATELSPEESAAVQKALTTYLADLRMEIANTDNAGYRRELQAERSTLESALGRLDGATAERAAGTGETITVVLAWTALAE